MSTKNAKKPEGESDALVNWNNSLVDRNNSLVDWSDVVHRMGEERREREKKLRAERSAWLRNYFEEGHVKYLGETRLIGWEVDGTPILNSKYKHAVLSSDMALNDIWEQIQTLAQFDHYLRDTLNLPT